MLAGRREDWPGAEVELLARAGAGQGAAAERHLEDDGRGAVAKRLAGRRGEEPSGSNCGRKCQCGSIGKRLLARPLWKSKAASAEEEGTEKVSEHSVITQRTIYNYLVVCWIFCIFK